MAKLERPVAGQWGRRPDPADLDAQVPLLRVPVNGFSNLIITSHDLVGCLVHYHRGRSTPCTGKPCMACEDNADRRWRGWLGVYAPKTTKQYILEITPACTKEIDQWFSDHRTLRGAMVAMCRIPKKANGRLHIDIRSSGLPALQLPEAPKVQDEMERLWSRNLARLHRHAQETELKIVADDQTDSQPAAG